MAMLNNKRVLIQNWFSGSVVQLDVICVVGTSARPKKVGQEKDKHLGSPDLYSTGCCKYAFSIFLMDMGWQVKFEKGEQMPRVKLNLLIQYFIYIYSFPLHSLNNPLEIRIYSFRVPNWGALGLRPRPVSFGSCPQGDGRGVPAVRAYRTENLERELWIPNSSNK